MEQKKTFGIKEWAEEDRPREKLMLKGKASLSNAELIAILINSGTKEMSAVDVAKQMLANAQNNLHELAKMDIAELKKLKGIGEARAITIVAALELGRRRKQSDVIEKSAISSAKDVHAEMAGHLMDLPYEEFWGLLLDRANKVIKKVKVSQGGVSGTIVDPKPLFKAALESLASGIILVHNHPSGNIKPSQEDRFHTQQIKKAGEYLQITVLDHVIFANEEYYSFAEEGTL